MLAEMKHRNSQALCRVGWLLVRWAATARDLLQGSHDLLACDAHAYSLTHDAGKSKRMAPLIGPETGKSIDGPVFQTTNATV